MSIWHIEELKPRPPRAQPQLQSAYTWDKERSLPDLESGFRVQSSDQAWVPYPSYLFVENGVRLGTYDPFAWGTEYESILQNRVDQVDGHLAPLDAPSQRDQIVNHDGFPLSQPPQVPQPVPGQIGGPGEEMGRKRKGMYAEQVPSKKGPPFGYFPKDVSFEQFAKGYEPTEEEKQFKEKSKKAVEDYERKKGEEESMKEEEKETVKEEELKEEEESKSYAPPKVEPEPESKSYMDVLTPMRIGMRSSQQRSISVSPILAPPSVIPLGYETPVQPSSLRRTVLNSPAHQESNLRSSSVGAVSFESAAFPIDLKRMKQTPLSSQPKEKKPTIQKSTPYERTEEKKESVMVTPAKIRETTAAPTPSTEEVKAMNFNKVREVAKQRHGITARSKNELISRLKGKLSATEWEKFKQEFKGELE